jgi:glutamyl/glutaminyl-tRNA synthetase
MADQMSFYFAADDAIEYEPDAAKKHLKGDGLEDALRDMRDALATVQPFDVLATEQAVRAVAERRGISAGKLIHPLRLALTGRGSSPPVFDVAVVLGRERTLGRLGRLIARVRESVPADLSSTS